MGATKTNLSLRRQFPSKQTSDLRATDQIFFFYKSEIWQTADRFLLLQMESGRRSPRLHFRERTRSQIQPDHRRTRVSSRTAGSDYRRTTVKPKLSRRNAPKRPAGYKTTLKLFICSSLKCYLASLCTWAPGREG